MSDSLIEVEAEEVRDSDIESEASTEKGTPDLTRKANIEYFDSHEVARKFFSAEDEIKKVELLDVKADLYLNRIACAKEKKENRKKLAKSKCHICDLEFDVISQLEEHKKGKQHKKVAARVQLKCKFCNVEFNSNSCKAKHFRGKIHKRNLRRLRKN